MPAYRDGEPLSKACREPRQTIQGHRFCDDKPQVLLPRPLLQAHPDVLTRLSDFRLPRS